MPFPRVKRIVSDFERAVFVELPLVPSHPQEDPDLKLSTAYDKKGPNPIHDFIFQLLCLAYLPGK